MLAAFAAAKKQTSLSTYIFEANVVGRRFIEALAEALNLGVDVHVLLDGVDEWIQRPLVGTLLKRQGVLLPQPRTRSTAP